VGDVSAGEMIRPIVRKPSITSAASGLIRSLADPAQLQQVEDVLFAA
jgi:hypothetical protein